MTVIEDLSIDPFTYKVNEIKNAIANNEPIEDKLNVIIVISNPCLFKKRYTLIREFIERMENEEEHIRLFVVELVYKKQKFVITEKNNKNHLRLRTDDVLWHKENMINIGVKKLLPKDYKAFAWIDADIEFENNTWAMDTLKILNGCKDVIQLFSHCVDLSNENTNYNIFNGFGYSFQKEKKYTTRGTDYWHPGYAWAITRRAYEKIGGLYDKGILGSGDNVMALAFINKCSILKNKEYTADYNESMMEYQKNAHTLRLGYTPGLILHHYHGTKQNRRYTERWKILMKHAFSPNIHIDYDKHGVLIPTRDFTEEFKEDIMNYFIERKEDD